MYYYIFDIKKCKKKSLVTDIKDYLSVLGISGEFTYPTHAYTTKELVELGLSKKYNTIVGIGDEEIANEISSVLCGRSEAMGIIPIEPSENLSQLLGSKTWKEAADNLRYRKITEMKIGKIGNDKGFLTSVQLNLPAPAEITMEFRDYLIQARVRDLTISNYNKNIVKTGSDFLDITMHSLEHRDEGLFNKLSSFFGKRETNMNFSIFRARSLRLFTSSQVPLISDDGTIVAKTPQFIECSDENLRLIVGKKSILVN